MALRIFVLFLILGQSSIVVVAQDAGGNSLVSPLRKGADSLMDLKQYHDAMPLLEELIKKYPQDPHYQYLLGLCYLNVPGNLEKAIFYFKKSSTQDVPNKVYFYLAESLRLSYRFNEAIDYYRRFTINGGDEIIKTADVEKLVNICENGSFHLKYIYSPPVITKKRVARDEFHKYYSVDENNGAFVTKPNDLKSSWDKKENESSIIFYPRDPIAGDYIYFSGFGNTTSYGRDIFRTQLNEDGYWSKPENLGDVINSSLDEDFPFITPDGVLYFASKGHYSMGGYDLYRSSYDKTAKKWSVPENLGFPFNSTFDDVLYIPKENDSIVCFATNRNVSVDSMEVVLVRLEEKPVRRSFSSIEEVLKIARLDPVTDDLKGITSRDKGKPGNKNNDTETVKPVTTLPPRSQTAAFTAIESDPEYMRVITKGFSEQAKADTLRIKLEKLRTRFDFITTADERRKLESQVVSVEDALLSAQKEADALFAKASQIEQEYLTGKRKSAKDTSISFTDDSPEFLYQAQFAPTVFRSDELVKLSKIEKLQPLINTIRDEIILTKNKLTNCNKSASDSLSAECTRIHDELVDNMNSYSDLMTNLYNTKYKIYSDCITVALAKSSTNNGDDARAEISRANTHFRAASAIMNNIGDEGRAEGVYEASLLNELGILRLEIAFARIWGMNLFEQQLTSKTLKIEKIAFGSTLPPVVEKKKDYPKVVDQVKPVKVEIVKKESDITTQPILFKKEQPPSFEIVEVSPYNNENPIPLDEPLPDGVLYKIQLAAFSNPVEVSFFKGMVPISGIKVNAKVTKYYAGKFINLSEAEQALSVVRSRGFKDAFVVAWLNGKSIPVARAQTMEDKQVNSNITGLKEQVADSSLVSTIYLVQIGIYTGKFPDEISQTVKAIAPNKDIIRKPDGQGRMVYLISSFLNYEEANRIKDNLIASGINSAAVIPVEVNKK